MTKGYYICIDNNDILLHHRFQNCSQMVHSSHCHDLFQHPFPADGHCCVSNVGLKTRQCVPTSTWVCMNGIIMVAQICATPHFTHLLCIHGMRHHSLYIISWAPWSYSTNMPKRITFALLMASVNACGLVDCEGVAWVCARLCRSHIAYHVIKSVGIGVCMSDWNKSRNGKQGSHTFVGVGVVGWFGLFVLVYTLSKLGRRWLKFKMWFGIATIHHGPI